MYNRTSFERRCCLPSSLLLITHLGTTSSEHKIPLNHTAVAAAPPPAAAAAAAAAAVAVGEEENRQLFLCG